MKLLIKLINNNFKLYHLINWLILFNINPDLVNLMTSWLQILVLNLKQKVVSTVEGSIMHCSIKSVL